MSAASAAANAAPDIGQQRMIFRNVVWKRMYAGLVPVQLSVWEGVGAAAATSTASTQLRQLGR